MEQRYVLELDGMLAGRMFSVKGGNKIGRHVKEESSDLYSTKKLASIEFEPLVFTFGAGMSRKFYEWVQSSLIDNQFPLNGSVIHVDNHSRMLHRQAFYSAMVSQIVFPDLDKFSQREAILQAVVRPHYVRTILDEVHSLGVYVSPLAKVWRVNQFRMTIEGLSFDCAHIFKIQELSEKLAKHIDQASIDHNSLSLEFPNITIELALPHGLEFVKWHQESVRSGRTNIPHRDGTIEFLLPGSSDVWMFRLHLFDMGIVSISKMSSSYRVQLVYRRMSLETGGSTIK